MDTKPAETVAEELLTQLYRRGVTRLFLNGGTDFASIVEAYARRDESGLEMPEVIPCAHENLALSMAHGAYLGDGATPAVMLHTSVGTANAVCATFGASRARVPVILMAGRTPLYEHGPAGSRDFSIHWSQEMYDQAGMLREFVKWDYELRGAPHVREVVGRAVDIATAEPRGPIYLTLPREVLALEPDEPVDAAGDPAVPAGASPGREAVAALAEHLAGARFPVITVASTGADEATVPLLAQLCDRFAVGVVEAGSSYVNIPGDHPMRLPASAVGEADVVVFLDVDVPWSPVTAQPASDAVVVHCGPDPLFVGYPIRSHRSDLSITATSRNLLTELIGALDERAGRIDPARRERLAALSERNRERRRTVLEAEAGLDGPITKPFMNWALHQVRPSDAVVVNEYWASGDLLGNTEPGTYFGSPPAGGLGWGLPAALGIQLARPDRTVIAALGDGAYLFANPAACHQAMAMHDLPVLTIVCTNNQLAAVHRSAMRLYPTGHTSRGPAVSPLARLDPTPDFSLYAQASGGYGQRVTERAELVPALRRALQVVREERRHALVDVQCT